jgi:NAD(P)H-dependent FMN reductase
MLKIQVIVGSTREGRQGIKVARWVYKNLKSDGRFNAELLDLKDFPLEFYHDEQTPGAINGNYESEIARRWSSKIREADGYIIVTPEYNRGYPGVLKNAIDYASKEWNNKPLAIVSYGGMAGGARAAEQLKMVSIELQMAPIRETVVIPRIADAFNEDGKPKDEFLNKVLGNLFNQLYWWTKALKIAREKEVSFINKKSGISSLKQNTI